MTSITKKIKEYGYVKFPRRILVEWPPLHLIGVRKIRGRAPRRTPGVILGIQDLTSFLYYYELLLELAKGKVWVDFG